MALAALPARPDLPTTAGLAKAVGKWVRAKALKPRVGVVVASSGGRTLYSHAGGKGYVPASATKLLTTAAALRQLGPGHRFTTSVYDADASSGSSATHTIVLRGGGDPLLSSRKAVAADVTDKDVSKRTAAGIATIDDLARRTATALRERGITKVRVRFDDRLFGPGVSPHWRENYISTGEVSKVSALTVDQGRKAVTGDLRVSSPAIHAADLFAAVLRKNSVTVTGRSERAKAPTGRAAIASVVSPPLDRIAEHVLLTSDNDAAEMLLRQTAIGRNQPPTFTGGVTATKANLSALGLDLAGLKLYDGSGLSPANRIPPLLLARLVATAMSPSHPELAATLSGLPVAGVSGTLRNRFHVVGTEGAGLVRGKTGTLNFVSALVGIAQTDDGAVLAYAFLADKLSADARPYEERVTALLTSCGCRQRAAGGGG